MVIKADNYPIGDIFLDISLGRLRGIYLSSQLDKLPAGNEYKILPQSAISKADEGDKKAYEYALTWLKSYFDGEILPADESIIEIEGSDFQKAVMRELMNIPKGKLVTYGEIAKKLEKTSKKRQSARAVGGAVGRNRLSIILPCHRVVGANGKLTGYTGGLSNKAWLLRHEGFEVEGNYARLG